tara:strand:+ start:3864 stop:4985 length:1122 start_codon:yes stop_codon:yes gene_type:complete
MTEESKDITIPTEFEKILTDFVKDLLITYPEYKDRLHKDIVSVVLSNDNDGEALERVFKHCSSVFPERFFDILYQKDEIFGDPEVNTVFLPDLEFKDLWLEDITDKTRETIWKYLQLLLFTTVSGVNSGDSFGDASKLFEAIDEDELKKKLEETVGNMHKMFDMSGVDMDGEDLSGVNLEDLPDPEELHSHITGMLEGKLGKLAKDIASETAEDLNINMDGVDSVNDVFQKLFKNPGKLMGLVDKVGKQLDKRIKSGEIKESELLEEANDLISKMKDMPGMGGMQNMMKNMGMPGGKMNMGAFQAEMDKNMKHAKMKERMQQKLAKKQETASQGVPVQTSRTFSTGEKVEKSKINPDEGTNKKKKKNRGKKKR